MSTHSCRLYLITPPALEPAAFADTLAAALDAGDVACVQLRLKDAGDDEVRHAIDRLMPVAQERDVAFLVNDRPDLAAEAGADGVHIGEDDTPFEEARRLVGRDAIIGVSCYNSRHRAMVAAEAGADYVAFGAFFNTETKEAKTRAEPDLLTWWQELMEIPCVAIGGITVTTGTDLVRAGADFLAVSGGVWSYADGPAAAVRDFNAAIAKAGEEETGEDDIGAPAS